MKKTFILQALMAMLPAALFAQNASLSGKISDAENGQPLPFVAVHIEGSMNGVLSDAEGNFSLHNVEGKNCCIIAYLLGYKADTTCIDLPYNGDLVIRLSRTTFIQDAVIVSSTRAGDNSAMAFTNVDKAQLDKQNFGQDLPYLLNLQPSVVTTSDAGTGIGYTGIRIRGSDATRVNVTINGVPLNDAEDQGTYWVDLPDFASSVDNIQVQRGVGTSTNGAGAFGGSVNIQTDAVQTKPYAETMFSGGSFNTLRTTVKAGTGLLHNNWAFDARASRITSDGYIDRGFSDLNSYYMSGGWYGKNVTVKAVVMSGKEKTYQCWYGVPQDSLKAGNRTYNPAGEYYDANGNVQYYNNETDNYKQDHYQLHFIARAGENWDFNAALHATKGAGYYEEFWQGESFSDYGLGNVIQGNDTITNTDLVRRLWLDNWFYGITYAANYDNHKKTQFTVGGAANKYDGGHYNEITWATVLPFATPGPYRYYDDSARKTDVNLFARINYQLTERLNIFTDLQVRNVDYKFNGPDTAGNTLPQNVSLTFFNPKAGLSFRINDYNLAYISGSVGNKEPNRDDYTQSTLQSRPKPETLYDGEAGWKFRNGKAQLGANLYYMYYVNQLVLTGRINDVGAYTRQNVPKSYRSGIELQAGWEITRQFYFTANATFSENKISDYNDYVDNYDNGGQQVSHYSSTDIAFSPSVTGAAEVGYNCRKGFSTAFTEKFVGRQYLDNTSNSTRQLDPYAVSGVRLSWTFHPKFMQELTVGALVNNLFNTMYSSNGYTYGWVYGGQTTYENYYYPQAGINVLGMLTMKF